MYYVVPSPPALSARKPMIKAFLKECKANPPGPPGPYLEAYKTSMVRLIRAGEAIYVDGGCELTTLGYANRKPKVN